MENNLFNILVVVAIVAIALVIVREMRRTEVTQVGPLKVVREKPLFD